MEDVVLVAAARTPFGKLGGGLSTLTAPDLGGCVIREVLSRAHVEGADVDEVIAWADSEARGREVVIYLSTKRAMTSRVSSVCSA